MLSEFVASWEIFYTSYLAGLFIALALSLPGIIVIARDQIFIGAATAQASMLGVTLAMFIGGAAVASLPQTWASQPIVERKAEPRLEGDDALDAFMREEGIREETKVHTHPRPLEAYYWHERLRLALNTDGFRSLLGAAMAVLAALLTARRRGQEALTGWVFLVGASGSVLAASHSAHGLEEVHRLVSSSLIGATDLDVLTFAALAAGSVMATLALGRRLLFATIDPSTAQAAGLRVGLLAALINVWLGLCLGLAIKTSGMLFSFGALVLPALIARTFCREVRQMALWVPLIAAGGALVAFFLAHALNYPPGQVAVALWCLMLAVAAPACRFRAR